MSCHTQWVDDPNQEEHGPPPIDPRCVACGTNLSALGSTLPCPELGCAELKLAVCSTACLASHLHGHVQALTADHLDAMGMVAGLQAEVRQLKGPEGVASPYHSRLRITISGLPKSGTTWAAVVIEQALHRAGASIHPIDGIGLPEYQRSLEVMLRGDKVLKGTECSIVTAQEKR